MANETTIVFFSGGLDSTKLLLDTVLEQTTRTIIPASFIIRNNRDWSSAYLCEEAARDKIRSLIADLVGSLNPKPVFSRNARTEEIDILFYGMPMVGQYGTWIYLASNYANYSIGVREIRLGTLIDDSISVYAREAQRTVFPGLAQITHRFGDQVKLLQPFLDNHISKAGIIKRIVDMVSDNLFTEAQRQIFREIFDATWWCEEPICGEISVKDNADTSEQTKEFEFETCGECQSCLSLKRAVEDLQVFGGIYATEIISINKTFLIEQSFDIYEDGISQTPLYTKLKGIRK